jgi:acyl carrier protein
MSVSKDSVVEMIFSVIDSTNKHLSGKKLEKSLDFELYGDNGNLDSMDLVNFIVDAEQAIEKTFSKPVVLADEKSLSQFNSPFKSVETLVDYILTKLNDV